MSDLGLGLAAAPRPPAPPPAQAVGAYLPSGAAAAPTPNPPVLGFSPAASNTMAPEQVPPSHVMPFKGTTEAPPKAADDLPPLSPADVDQTAPLGLVIEIDDAIPFSSMPGTAADDDVDSTTVGGVALPDLSPFPVADRSESTSVPTDLGPMAEHSTPFASKSARADEPALTLEQYASLRAELAANPANTEAVWARYGLADADARDRIQQDWTERLSRDDAMQTRMMELVAQYRAWLGKRQ